jgi:RHS repeat-associated protein
VSESDPDYVDLAFAYTGRLLDKATGLQNNLNRWYDARVGRWLSEDPIGFNAGDANLYRYVGNGPVNGVDPSGLVPPGRPEGPAPPGFAKWLDGKGPKPPGASPQWCDWYRKVAEEAIEKNQREIIERGPSWKEGPNNINKQLNRIKTLDQCPKPTPPTGPWLPRFQMLLRLPWIMVMPPEYWDSDGDGIRDGIDRDTPA